jgi:hypothetical protein
VGTTWCVDTFITAAHQCAPPPWISTSPPSLGPYRRPVSPGGLFPPPAARVRRLGGQQQAGGGRRAPQRRAVDLHRVDDGAIHHVSAAGGAAMVAEVGVVAVADLVGNDRTDDMRSHRRVHHAACHSPSSGGTNKSPTRATASEAFDDLMGAEEFEPGAPCSTTVHTTDTYAMMCVPMCVARGIPHDLRRHATCRPHAESSNGIGSNDVGSRQAEHQQAVTDMIDTANASSAID